MEMTDEIVKAAVAFVDTCQEALTDEAKAFTCVEAESIDRLIRAVGADPTEFRLSHAWDDDAESDKHHGGWTE